MVAMKIFLFIVNLEMLLEENAKSSYFTDQNVENRNNLKFYENI
jgi:hypothetical protein